MSKLKKICISIIIILLIVGIVFFTIKIFINSRYGLESVSAQINSATLPTNVHIKNVVNSDENTQYVDYYIKDGSLYICQKNDSSIIVETLQDKNFSEEWIVLHTDKLITKTTDTKAPELPLKNTFCTLAEKAKKSKEIVKYKYCGKDNIEGKECIKVSFEDSSSNKIEMMYFYIDLETNYIVKYEYYEGSDKQQLNKKQTETYDYEMDSVVEDDIPKFDIHNYPDYQYTEK